MVAGVAVDYVEILDLVEMVFRRVRREDRTDTRVETATEDRRQTRLLEPVVVRPLPTVLEFRLIFRLVIRRVEIVHSALQARVHNGEILIRQSDVDHDVGGVLFEQGDQFGHVVCIDGGGFNAARAMQCVDGGGYRVGLCDCAAGEHNVGENGIGGHFVCNDGPYPAGADDDDFRHFSRMINDFIYAQKYRIYFAEPKKGLTFAP